jgi:exodeoxyribonuclease VII large subunit
MQPTLFSANRLTVSQLTLRIRTLLEGDPALQDVWVEGEISNLSRPASGHIYFTLKDRTASLRCVMWKTDAARSRPDLREGMAAEAHGRIVIYEPQGQYQLVTKLIQARGEGALYREFLRLKDLLESEGLFAPERKRPIPRLPRRIGIVTSPSGAALRDILNTLGRRLPLAQVLLAPSPVQGVEAPPVLVDALRSLNRRNPDVIVLARGGGSIEDLWAFNDERVVRAVAASHAPVICGVGHETDFTLCDFACDLRAPTPTAAAELATPATAADLLEEITALRFRLTASILAPLADRQAQVSTLTARLNMASPGRRVLFAAQSLDELSRRALTALSHRIQMETAVVDGMSKRLAALNPLRVLARGYAIVTRKDDGAVVSRVAQAGSEMLVRVSDGTFEVKR